MKAEAKFVGIDSWSRPVFKQEGRRNYFCLVDVLLDGNAPQSEIEDMIDGINAGRFVLYEKDSDFDGEPGYPVKNVHVLPFVGGKKHE